MYLYLNRQLGSQINRLGNGEKIVKQLTAVKKKKKNEKKIIKLRNFANCEIIELGVAVQGGSNT